MGVVVVVVCNGNPDDQSSLFLTLLLYSQSHTYTQSRIYRGHVKRVDTLFLRTFLILGYTRAGHPKLQHFVKLK